MRDPGSGSRFRNLYLLPIPDPGVKKAPDPGSRICNTACVHGEEAEGVDAREGDPDFLPIPDPGVKKAPDPGSATLLVCREKKQKAVMREKEILCPIRILAFYHPGSRGQKGTGSRIRICNTACVQGEEGEGEGDDAGSRIRISVPEPDFLPFPDPGVKKAPDPDPGSGTATLLVCAGRRSRRR